MGVNGLCCACVAVAQMLRYYLHRHTHIYKKRSVSMAQVMDMNVREVVLSQKLLELQIYLGFRHVLAVGPGENGSSLNPAVSCGFTALVLPYLLLPKDFHQLWR